MDLLPGFCKTIEKDNPKDFIRSRKLPLMRLIVFILHIVAGSRRNGIDIRLGEFFGILRHNGLLDHHESLSRSAFTKARKKLKWEAFSKLHRNSVDLAYSVFPERDEYVWHGMSVYAFDGSKYTLPASSEIREKFDPDSGLDKPGKGHYPQAQINTVIDVFRRIPVGRTICPIKGGNEREQALSLLPLLPAKSICLFDRGYPSYDFIQKLLQQQRYFCIRCPGSSTFSAVEAFLKNGSKEGFIWLTPSGKFKRLLNKKEGKELICLKLRVISLVNPDGKKSVLLTNIFDASEFSRADVTNLYYRRWAVENHYRDEKVGYEIEHFHAKTVNGVCQELFAILVVCVLARVLCALSVPSESVETSKCVVSPQFKNAVVLFAHNVTILITVNLCQTLSALQEILYSISCVKYYRPKLAKPSQPRTNKGAVKKWQVNRQKKESVAA